MRGDVETIKNRLDIVEVLSGYVKLEKAGNSLRARCPFHNEKTPSFFVSPVRQNFYCFGCGAKGDIFTFVEEVEGLDFRGAMKFLAEKAGVEIEFQSPESKTEKDKILNVLEEAAKFFEKQLANNDLAYQYLVSRGVNLNSCSEWRLGYAPDEWRCLYGYLLNLGYEKDIILKAGLIKKPLEDTSLSKPLVNNKEPYDVFRNRIIFPLFDSNGSVIAFSGRELSKGTASSLTSPKYLNSPETSVFTKSEVLYGLDKAKNHIRSKDYAVLVEGQIDLVLSHQVGTNNTVASSGTALTSLHLERLKRFSSRIIFAFDGDEAGKKAVERASSLAIYLGFEVKVANLPEDLDPAEVIKNNPQSWKDLLKGSVPAVEFFFLQIKKEEKDPRKLGKEVEKRILPMIKLVKSAIEQSHFISMLAKQTGIKEELLWEDLKKVKSSEIVQEVTSAENKPLLESISVDKTPLFSYREQIEQRLAEIVLWEKDLPELSDELEVLKKEKIELTNNLDNLSLRENLNQLIVELSLAEKSEDSDMIKKITHEIQEVHTKMIALEQKKKIL